MKEWGRNTIYVKAFFPNYSFLHFILSVETRQLKQKINMDG